jgi:hypothetical protein
MATISAATRLADWLERDVRSFWAEHGEGPSVGLRRVVEEWWAMQHFPAIEFRDGVSGRRAALRGGPDVWEVVMVARDYGNDRERLSAHFGGRVANEALAQALAYAERFPDEINSAIAENERVARFLTRQAG